MAFVSTFAEAHAALGKLLANWRTAQGPSPYSSTPAASGGVTTARPAGQRQLQSPQWPSVLG